MYIYFIIFFFVFYNLYNLCLLLDSQYGVNVKNAWKLHESERNKCYLLTAKTAVDKQRWFAAFQAERNCVQKDQENSK